jgi:hypothetical protein
LTVDDADRFSFDCGNLKACFLCPSLPLEHTFRDLLDAKLRFVTDLVDLITQDYKSEHCQVLPLTQVLRLRPPTNDYVNVASVTYQEIIHSIAGRYSGE